MTPAAQTREPRTAAGRRILRQDYRGNEAYTVTRQDILAIEAEAAAPASPDVVAVVTRHYTNVEARLGMWDSDTPETLAMAQSLDAVNGPLPDGENEPFPSWQRDWAVEVLQELAKRGYRLVPASPEPPAGLDVERLARAIRIVGDSDPAEWLERGDETDAIAAAYAEGEQE